MHVKPTWALQSVTTDAHPLNEELLSDFLRRFLSKMTVFIIAVITSILSSSTEHARGGVWALLLTQKPASGSPGGSERVQSSQRGPLFERILVNSFEDDHYHHCNHNYHHHHNAVYTQGDVSEHFGCRSSPIGSLQSGSTDAFPPNVDLSSVLLISRPVSRRMLVLTHGTYISLVIRHCPDLFNWACSRVLASARHTWGLWGQSAEETAHAPNFHKTIHWEASVEISAVFQVKCLKFWT